jgi:SAM-dependent methyltransferase
VYQVVGKPWREIAVDLFEAPLQTHREGVCASILDLPFRDATFGTVVCVGEVLAYCDPASALREFARVLVPSGYVIVDFRSTRSARYWLTRSHGRAVDFVADQYNGSEEKTWVYDPSYMTALLKRFGFRVVRESTTHRWSSLLHRIGVPRRVAVRAERRLERVPFPSAWADLTTVVAQFTSERAVGEPSVDGRTTA